MPTRINNFLNKTKFGKFKYLLVSLLFINIVNIVGAMATPEFVNADTCGVSGGACWCHIEPCVTPDCNYIGDMCDDCGQNCGGSCTKNVCTSDHKCETRSTGAGSCGDCTCVSNDCPDGGDDECASDSDPVCGAPSAPSVSVVTCTDNPRPQWTWDAYSVVKDPDCGGGFTENIDYVWTALSPDKTNTNTNDTTYIPSTNLASGSYTLDVWYANQDNLAGSKGSATVNIDTTIPLPGKPKVNPSCSGDGNGIYWVWSGANDAFCGDISWTDLQKVGGPGSTWGDADPDRVDVGWLGGLQTQWSAGTTRYNGDYVRVRFKEAVGGIEKTGTWVDGDPVVIDSVRPTVTSGSIDPSDCVITSNGAATWTWSNPTNSGCFSVIRTEIDLVGSWGVADGIADKTYAGTKTSFYSKDGGGTLTTGDYIRVRYIEGDNAGQVWPNNNTDGWYSLPAVGVCDYKVTLTPDSATITEGDTYRFTAQVTPDPIWPYQVDISCATARVSSPSPTLPSCRWLDMSGNPFFALGHNIPFNFQVEIYNTTGFEGHMLALAYAESQGQSRKDQSDLYINKASGDSLPTCSFSPMSAVDIDSIGEEDFVDFVLNIKDNIADVDYVISTSAGRIALPSPSSGTVYSTDSNVNVRWGQDTVLPDTFGIVLTAQLTDSVGQTNSCNATLDFSMGAHLAEDWGISIVGESSTLLAGNNMNFTAQVRDTIGDWKYPVDLSCILSPYAGATGSLQCTPVTLSVGEPSNANEVAYLISNTAGGSGTWNVEVQGLSMGSERQDDFNFTFSVAGDNPPSCSFSPSTIDVTDNAGEDYADFQLNIQDDIADVDYTISTSRGRIVIPSPTSGTVASTNSNINVRWGQDTITPSLGILVRANVTDSSGQVASCSATVNLRTTGDNPPVCSIIPSYKTVNDTASEDMVDFQLNLQDDNADIDYTISTSAGRIVLPSPANGTVASTNSNINLRWGQDTVPSPALGITVSAQVWDSIGQSSVCNATVDLTFTPGTDDFYVELWPSTTSIDAGYDASYSGYVREVFGTNWTDVVFLTCTIYRTDGGSGDIPTCVVPASKTVSDAAFPVRITNTTGNPGTYNVTLTGTSGGLVRSDTATLYIDVSSDPSFMLTIYPNETVVRKGSTLLYGYRIRVLEKDGFKDPITLRFQNNLNSYGIYHGFNDLTTTSVILTYRDTTLNYNYGYVHFMAEAADITDPSVFPVGIPLIVRGTGGGQYDDVTHRIFVTDDPCPDVEVPLLSPGDLTHRTAVVNWSFPGGLSTDYLYMQYASCDPNIAGSEYMGIRCPTPSETGLGWNELKNYGWRISCEDEVMSMGWFGPPTLSHKIDKVIFYEDSLGECVDLYDFDAENLPIGSPLGSKLLVRANAYNWDEDCTSPYSVPLELDLYPNLAINATPLNPTVPWTITGPDAVTGEYSLSLTYDFSYQVNNLPPTLLSSFIWSIPDEFDLPPVGGWPSGGGNLSFDPPYISMPPWGWADNEKSSAPITKLTYAHDGFVTTDITAIDTLTDNFSIQAADSETSVIGNNSINITSPADLVGSISAYVREHSIDADENCDLGGFLGYVSDQSVTVTNTLDRDINFTNVTGTPPAPEFAYFVDLDTDYDYDVAYNVGGSYAICDGTFGLQTVTSDQLVVGDRNVEVYFDVYIKPDEPYIRVDHGNASIVASGLSIKMPEDKKFIESDGSAIAGGVYDDYIYFDKEDAEKNVFVYENYVISKDYDFMRTFKEYAVKKYESPGTYDSGSTLVVYGDALISEGGGGGIPYNRLTSGALDVNLDNPSLKLIVIIGGDLNIQYDIETIEQLIVVLNNPAGGPSTTTFTDDVVPVGELVLNQELLTEGDIVVERLNGVLVKGSRKLFNSGSPLFNEIKSGRVHWIRAE